MGRRPDHLKDLLLRSKKLDSKFLSLTLRGFYRGEARNWSLGRFQNQCFWFQIHLLRLTLAKILCFEFWASTGASVILGYRGSSLDLGRAKVLQIPFLLPVTGETEREREIVREILFLNYRIMSLAATCKNTACKTRPMKGLHIRQVLLSKPPMRVHSGAMRGSVA